MDSKEINWEYKYKRLKNTVTACLILVLFITIYNNWSFIKAGAKDGWNGTYQSNLPKQ
jgi:hypothetical protein